MVFRKRHPVPSPPPIDGDRSSRHSMGPSVTQSPPLAIHELNREVRQPHPLQVGHERETVTSPYPASSPDESSSLGALRKISRLTGNYNSFPHNELTVRGHCGRVAYATIGAYHFTEYRKHYFVDMS